ncbi:MAG: energy transducer TonB [Sediminibacterium magnilacihabitans]|jgi:protein TonB|nr:energy transducer TonB [Sediminibacterium magnilacihabitans]PQV60205.1 outer membrane transport energization protein TonB [Sediminibacterium magnilacihabitans]
MEKKDILAADFLDLLFEGRNKAYGAYDLRKTYNKRITYALGGTTLVCMLFIAGSIWAHAKKKSDAVLIVGPTVVLENIKQDEPKPEEIKPLKPEQQKVATTQYVVPKIVQDDQVKPEDEMKDMAVLEDTKIGTMNVEGTKDDNVVAPPVEAKGTGVVVAPKGKDEDLDKIFYSVQIPASFNGGEQAWRKYLERNLNSDVPVSNGAPPAKYTVIISFVVDRFGKISDVKAENDPGYGTKEEALRVILKGPDWVPAEQNGIKVAYRHCQSIAFDVYDGN